MWKIYAPEDTSTGFRGTGFQPVLRQTDESLHGHGSGQSFGTGPNTLFSG